MPCTQLAAYHIASSLGESGNTHSGGTSQPLVLEVHLHLPVPVLHHHLLGVTAGARVLNFVHARPGTRQYSSLVQFAAAAFAIGVAVVDLVINANQHPFKIERYYVNNFTVHPIHLCTAT